MLELVCSYGIDFVTKSRLFSCPLSVFLSLYIILLIIIHQKCLFFFSEKVQFLPHSSEIGPC